MAGQRGRDILLKVSYGGSQNGFVTLAGIRSTEFELGATSVDGTAADSENGWRELVSGAGIKSAKVRGSGVFKDAESDERMRELFFSATLATWQLVIPGLGVLEGPFHIRTLKWGGAFDGEASFSIDLESAGALSFDTSAVSSSDSSLVFGGGA